MEKTGLGALIASLALCLPCLVVVVAAVGGGALASGAAGWLARNAAVAVVGVGTAIALAAGILIYRRRCAAECEVRPDASRDREPAQLGR